MIRSLSIAAVVCFGASALTGVAHADDRLPTKKRTLLLFKVLTFDKGLTKGRDALRTGVVAMKGSAESEKVAQETLAQLKKISHMRVQKLAITPSNLTVGDAKQLAKLITDKKINVLYLAPKIDKLMGTICKLAKQKKLLVLSGENKHAKKCATLTVVARDNKPKIIINKKAASAQGASFKGAVLNKAQVID